MAKPHGARRRKLARIIRTRYDQTRLPTDPATGPLLTTYNKVFMRTELAARVKGGEVEALGAVKFAESVGEARRRSSRGAGKENAAVGAGP